MSELDYSFRLSFPLCDLWCRVNWVESEFALVEARWAAAGESSLVSASKRVEVPSLRADSTLVGRVLSAEQWSEFRGLKLSSFSGLPSDVRSVALSLQCYLREPRLGELPSMKAEGTHFQMRVWQELCSIPPGETRTYGEVARRLGIKGGARAVGAANRVSPIMLFVPCHRVVASNSLGGYAYGAALKEALLAWEGIGAGSQCASQQLLPMD